MHRLSSGGDNSTFDRCPTGSDCADCGARDVAECTDLPNTGFALLGQASSCAMLRSSGACENPVYGEEVRTACPMSCDQYVS